jgi:hypothetical protein
MRIRSDSLVKLHKRRFSYISQYRGVTSSDQIITWFWDIVSRLKEEEKALLLKFSTGSPCVPIGGFASLQVCSQGAQAHFLCRNIQSMYFANKRLFVFSTDIL